MQSINAGELFEKWWSTRRLGWESQFDDKYSAARDAYINGYYQFTDEERKLLIDMLLKACWPSPLPEGWTLNPTIVGLLTRLGWRPSGAAVE